MMKYAVVILVVIVCISCKEATRETLQILIQNRTDSLVHITLYPKGLNEDGFYIPYEGSRGFRKPDYNLLPHNDNEYSWLSEMIFATPDLTIKPYTLALREFDSIYIRTALNLIIFTHKDVTGYSENIFSENSTWDFEVGEWDERTIRKNPQRGYLHRFLILEDKIIINQ